jgi:hypothetical protein
MTPIGLKDIPELVRAAAAQDALEPNRKGAT